MPSLDLLDELKLWLDEQVLYLEQPSVTEVTRGAIAAFSRTQQKIEELIREKALRINRIPR